MKTKNQTEQVLLELAVTKAANEEGFAANAAREATPAPPKGAWSPLEVWRTRVKNSDPLNRGENAPA